MDNYRSDYGEGILSVMSLLESAVSGNLLANRNVDVKLSNKHSQFLKALTDYLNNSMSLDSLGQSSQTVLNQFVKHKQDIFNNKYDW